MSSLTIVILCLQRDTGRMLGLSSIPGFCHDIISQGDCFDFHHAFQSEDLAQASERITVGRHIDDKAYGGMLVASGEGSGDSGFTFSVVSVSEMY